MSDVKGDASQAWIPVKHYSSGRRTGERAQGPGEGGVSAPAAGRTRRYISPQAEIGKGVCLMDPLLTREQVAMVLQVSLTTVKRLLGDGALRFAKIRGAVRVPQSAVENMVRERMVG